MTALLAWAWAPVLLYGTCLGLGLLVDRVLRTEVPPALIPPLGLAVAIVALVPVYRLGASATVAAPLLVLAAAAGLVLTRKRLRERAVAIPAMAAAGAVYVLHMLPVLASGDAVWAGYNFVNDTVANFILIDLLEHHGTTAPVESSVYSSVAGFLGSSGYPIGAHALPATVRPLTGAPVDAIYQPVLALFAALAAMPLTELARRAGLRPASTALAAIVAMGGVLIYRYSLHGAIKELAVTTLCTTAAALALVAVDRRLGFRHVTLLALCALAMVFAYSAAAGVYALGLAVVVLALAYASEHRPSWRHVARLSAAVAAIGCLALLPTLGSTLDFAQLTADVFSGDGADAQTRFGHLARPLPVSEAAGVWLGRDYRLPVDPGLTTLNAMLVGASIAMAALGVALCIARRRPGPLALLGVVGLPAAALAPFVSPYIDGKLMVTLTPAVVFLAMLSGLLLLELRPLAARLLGGIAVIVVAGGVLASDLYTYRETKLPPPDRLSAMEDAAANAPGNALWLFNEWEEFGKYFMRSVRLNPAAEAQAPRPVALRRRAEKFGRYFDLDRQRLSYVQRFQGIIMRRSPAASRPPASFRMIYRNAYYELWRRDTGVRVMRHLPLQRLDRATAPVSCEDVRSFAERAREGDRLLAARPAPVVSLSPFVAERPDAWRPSFGVRGTVTPFAPGRLTGPVTTAAEGPMRVWLRMTGGRPYTVLVDGRRLGEVGQINTPGQWLEAGIVRLAKGRHRIEVRRSGASAGPGDAFRGELGPVALQSTESPELVSVAPRNADRLCGRSWDWIEVVRG